MDRIDKQQIRDFIGQHLPLGKTRLSDEDAVRLRDVIKDWAKYAGGAYSHENEHDGWGSDGKYTVLVKTTTTFLKDRVGVQIERSRFIDGVPQGTTREVLKPREILDLLKKRPWVIGRLSRQ